MALNAVVLQGRLTREPELRRTQNGTAVTSFSLAVDRDFKGQDGKRETDFIDVVAWRGTAELAAKYLTKGCMALVSGRLQLRDWQDKDGNRRRSAEVIAEGVYFCDSKKEDGGCKAAGKAVDVDADDFAEVEEDGDLPF